MAGDANGRSAAFSWGGVLDVSPEDADEQRAASGCVESEEVVTAAKMLAALVAWYGLWLAIEVWL